MIRRSLTALALAAALPALAAELPIPEISFQKFTLDNGLTVIIQHSGGDYSVYGSLDRIDVRKGARVIKGQALGTVGISDPALGSHLHFEIRRGGPAVDPAEWLRAAR